MKDDRLRAPLEDDYALALGRAAYVFARLEWNAVWCCERMQSGYIGDLARKTAGQIGADFVRLARAHAGAGGGDFVGDAERFRRLVNTRNAILHAKPGTAPGGAQRLFRDGEAWSTDAIDEAADEFAACSIRLNALLYGALAAA